jgi:hypothetical protein
MRKAVLALLLLLAGVMAAGTASAHGRGGARVHFGFFVGGPVWGPWYYPPPYPYYYPAPVYVTPPAPPVYVERQDVAPTSQPQDWWYYCEQSRGYYPYVKSCPGGWQRVPPAPPPG